MTINSQQVASWLRQAAAIAIVVMSALDTISMPTAVRASLGAVAAALLAVEHYVSDPSTGTPTPKPVPVASVAQVSQQQPVG
jgi:hypothetical protein